MSTGERVLVSRELPEGDEEDLGSGSEDVEGCLISGSVPGPVGAPGISRGRTLELRDRNGACHPLLCGREGARKCGVEEIMTIK